MRSDSLWKKRYQTISRLSETDENHKYNFDSFVVALLGYTSVVITHMNPLSIFNVFIEPLWILQLFTSVISMSRTQDVAKSMSSRTRCHQWMHMSS